MKKTLLWILAASMQFVACNQDEKEERKISHRNYSITKDNAYNNLFMDSLSVVNYITENEIPDSIARRIISFYNHRNYQYAWFSSEGVSEQAMGFSSLLNFTDDTSKSLKKLHKKMHEYIGAENLKVTPENKAVLQTELLLTENLIAYTKSNFKKGYVKRKEIEKFIPYVKENAIVQADSLLAELKRQKKDFADINKPYKLLSDQLERYLQMEKNKKWMLVDGDLKTFKPGNNSPIIAAMKQNLFLMGDLPAEDSSGLYDDNLVRGIKSFQWRNGFTPDGKVSENLINLLNIPPKQRVKQLLINMNRMRWLPYEPDGKLIIVNTPAFILRAMDGKKEVFEMPVVVGKNGHNTTIFSDLLTTIVFSPYWNIPPSIVKSEILPSMEKDPDYLEINNMEITNEVNGLPEIRQKPGEKNSLGKVKFLFPNSFNIYFHDTPAKALFDKDVRAYSHGCIRLAEPQKLAAYLLQNEKNWGEAKINAAMNKGEEKFVKLSEPVPVFISYYTAWVDDAGKLHFREDIYGHDAEVMKKMFLY
jgi:murein L,D-transpeptidase YcbB/YkuD